MHLATGITPKAVVVSDARPHTPEWFEARRMGITGTDVPKILGESEYGNAVTVYLDKQGMWEDEAGEAAEWGTELEPVVAKVWARRNNTRVTDVEMLARKGEKDRAGNLWMRANLDRVVSDCPLAVTTELDPANTDLGISGTATVRSVKRYGCALEIKTKSAFVAGRWADDIPDDVLAQVAWQRIVTGYPHIHVAVLFGGQRMATYLYEKDTTLEAFIVDEARRVWNHVLDCTRPEARPNALLVRALDVLYPNREGVVDIDKTLALELTDAYETARLDADDAKNRKDEARARMVQALEGGEVAVVDDLPAFSYRANKNGVRSIRIDRAYKKETAS